VFYIVPEKCTECVGFHDQEACAAVCPVDVCIPNPDIPETEAQLIQRAKELHPDVDFGASFPSRFREGNGAATSEPEAAAPAAAPAASVAAAPAAPAVAAKPVVGGRTEKPLAKPQLTPAAKVPRQEKTFPDELKMSFEDAVALLGQGRGEAPASVKWMMALAQPVLGALPFKHKRDLELAVGDRRFFSAAGATGFNALHNLLLYPILFAAVGAVAFGHSVFSQELRWMIFLGAAVSVIESIWRMREGFRGLPPERTVYRAALYGLPLVPVAVPVVRLLKAPVEVEGTVGQDGFRSDQFDEKIERERRYGQVYRLHTDVNGHLLEFEFPRKTPASAIRVEMGIGDEMPDYDYDIRVQGKSFVVKGKVTDPNLRRAAAVSSAFPPDFTTTIPLPSRVAGFRHRFVDKNLEVALPKRI
jgi:hypothetical protein